MIGAALALPAGTRLSSYEVLSLLGVGGMGEVYRARDLRLGRDVAIKVLPADVTRDADRLNRFRREAKSLAAVDHPNIVTVFSVEEAQVIGFDIVHFLTMQLVEGQSLDQLIPDRGLPLERILDISAAIADALAAAHDKHIVHRDLKPANVMVAGDGRVKVLDFGLAKDLTESGDAGATVTSAGRTEHGVVMGTPAYMSPEQVAGRAVDHRSDIFSLGILIYQMASGERPFKGGTSIEVASAILRDTPPAVTDARGDLPDELARLIRRCLEKQPGERIQTARDVGHECRDLLRQPYVSAAPLSARPSSASVLPSGGSGEGFRILVTPFKYAGTNAELVALAEGLAEEIVTGLSRFSYLRVISRGSSARDARYVVDGSIRQAGSQLRVTVQLVDTTTGAHLWAESFDRSYRPEDVFGLQDELVARIVSTIADQHGVLVHSMSAVIRRKSDAELSPHEAALSVFGFHERMTPEEHARVRTILEGAVAEAPDDSDCWAMLATVYTDEYMFGFNVLPDPLGRAQAAARRAVALAPSSALASQALAQSLFFRKELDACRPVAERTIALNPMDGAIGAFMGLLLALCGDWQRGCATAEAARKLNPHFPGWYWLPPLFEAYYNGDYRAAIGIAMRVNIPGYFWVPLTTAAAFGQLGELDSARKALKELLSIRPGFASTARAELEKWFDPALVESFMTGLHKAGLERGLSVHEDERTE
jgi:serine/threonine protein kinase/tetratricopeptide (TPR) repeat protein